MVNIDVSLSLVPALMPLLARLRQLLDLDAEPAVVDACLEEGGLGALVRQRPGLRIPGAFEGFELTLCALLSGSAKPGVGGNALVRDVVAAFGEPIETGIASLTRLMPTAERIAEAGAGALITLGAPPRRAHALVTVAQMILDGALRLEPGSDPTATQSALLAIDSVGDRLATTIVMRALRWPDALPATDPSLQFATGTPSARELIERAEVWRPWRAYAALHLWGGAQGAEGRGQETRCRCS